MISDNFDRANGPIGGNWTSIETAAIPTIDANAALGTTAGNYSAAIYSGSAWNATHSSKVVVGVALYCGPIVRGAGPLNWINWLDDSGVNQSVAGVVTSLGSRGAPIVAGDILQLSVSGLTLTPYKNGVELASITLDGVLTNGAPGIIFYGATAKLNSWEGAGEVVTAPPFTSTPYAMRIR